MQKKIISLLVLCTCVLQFAVPAFSQSMQITTTSDDLNSYEDVSSVSDDAVQPSGRSTKVTLELKGVDILDVLKVLSKKSGLNIVAGKNVRGQVTLFLQDVDVWDALKIVLETSDLAYEKKGDIIKVITESDYEARYGRPYEDKTVTEIIKLTDAKVQIASEILNQLKSTVGRIIIDESTNSMIIIDTSEALASMQKAIKMIDVPMETRVFPLKYAKAEDIEAQLSELVTPNVGVIKVDNRTNKVVVTDIAAKLDHITEMVYAFDEKPIQVLIEAKIIEVVLEDEYVLGIDWNVVMDRTNTESYSFGNNSLGGRRITRKKGPLAGTEATNLPMFTINSAGDDFNAIISALEAMGKTNTLSNPRVTVLNNEEASIEVATKQPFVSQTVVQGDSTSTTADNVEFVDVGVTLTVVPTITKDQYILMEVNPEVSTAGTPLTLTSTDSNGQQFTRTVVPVVTSQEVETKVIIQSGTTLVLGGLIQDSQSVVQKKVPFLGDIPWLGSAFRNKSDDFKKTELVVFITPYILRPDIDSEEFGRFFDSNREPHSFNEMGGVDSNYYEATSTSQSYVHTDDNSFWEEYATPPAKINSVVPHFKREKSYTIDRELELKRTMESLNSVPRSTSKERPVAMSPSVKKKSVVPMTPLTPAKKQAVSNNPSQYSRTIKESIFSAIRNEPSLKKLSGEVEVNVSVSDDGYLNRLRARSLKNTKLNNLLILAINNNSPYPKRPRGSGSDDRDLSFSLFF